MAFLQCVALNKLCQKIHIHSKLDYQCVFEQKKSWFMGLHQRTRVNLQVVSPFENLSSKTKKRRLEYANSCENALVFVQMLGTTIPYCSHRKDK